MPPLPLIGTRLRIEWAPARAPSGDAKGRQIDTRTVNKIHKFAQVAQLVEHVTENHGVGGSIPPLGTKTYLYFNDLTWLIRSPEIERPERIGAVPHRPV